MQASNTTSITEVIDGLVSDQVGNLKDFMECRPANGAYDCQAGITMGHIKARKALASSGEQAAWIFEDDAVLYDRAAVLIPHYWARVPHDYKVVYIGHIQSDSTLPKEIVHVPPKTLRMGTHAYILFRDELSLIMTP
ncbi:hypothetical protein WJX75_007171 [Coccomyxa subellipsoidea]|uniref:Glycosyltransferase family 25 protein n=1 Tax=Coccomyxa subellipsoidea TaxID=248742 RepID=A0ABR2Z5W0_9CHLO